MNRRQQISDLLAQHPDGLTRAEIQKRLDIDSDGFANSVKRMPHVYIDRWQAKRVRQPNGGGRIMWVAVYCLIESPGNAPKPDRKPTSEDLID